jgi:hypothetical protein
MRPRNENGRATWTRPEFLSPDGAPGTALDIGNVTVTLESDATYYCVPAYHGRIKAGVAGLHTGDRDARDRPSLH